MSLNVTLTSVSLAAGTVGALVTAWLTFREYKLKARAQRAEIEIALARLFAELVPIANARGSAVVSAPAVTAIAAANPAFTQDDLDRAVVHIGVGLPTQASAIASLGHLGSDYHELRDAARAALQSLDFVDVDPQLEVVP